MSTPDGGTHVDQDPETEQLRRRLEEAKKQELHLRADFANLRRRMEREQDVARHDGKREVLGRLLPVLDAFERALEAGSTDEPFYEGMTATHRLFVDGLRAAGAEPIVSAGERFDPTRHEAVAIIDVPDAVPGTVTGEVRRGWSLGDALLRPSQDVVAAAPEADDRGREVS
jgi:molecular chaperone GrpE